MPSKRQPTRGSLPGRRFPPLPWPASKEGAFAQTSGALPILNRRIERTRLEKFLPAALPPEDRRMKLAPVKALLVLLRNLLVSRVPMYGIGEWAVRHAADALGLIPQEIGRRNDDSVGRALDRLFLADVPSLVLWEKTDAEGGVIDGYSTSDQPATTAEGYRRLWYHSLRKAEQDAVVRSGRIEPALKQLATLKEKLRSPRTRYRQEVKVAAAVAEILETWGATAWIVTEVQPQNEETFHQDHRGRPGKDTRYVKKVATRFDLSYRIDDARVALDARSDGIFPLVTNVADFSTLELLHAYKRQPVIEKRFSQLKTDFAVAPVYLKAVHRIQCFCACTSSPCWSRPSWSGNCARRCSMRRSRRCRCIPRGVPAAGRRRGG